MKTHHILAIASVLLIILLAGCKQYNETYNEAYDDVCTSADGTNKCEKTPDAGGKRYEWTEQSAGKYSVVDKECTEAPAYRCGRICYSREQRTYFDYCHDVVYERINNPLNGDVVICPQFGTMFNLQQEDDGSESYYCNIVAIK